MRGRLLILILMGTVAMFSPSAEVKSAPAPEAGMVAGIVSSGTVIVAAVPLASGAWGTDYITVSHALSVQAQYAVIRDGLPYAHTTPITACSSEYHGIDVLILRAASHVGTPVVEWGDPAELKAGDELQILPRREIHAEPVTVKFIHVNLGEWTKTLTQWSPQWRNTMVGDGMSMPGFSGSPWVRNGKVFGLHKGWVKPTAQSKQYVVAETATKVRDCLKLLNYASLVPSE